MKDQSTAFPTLTDRAARGGFTGSPSQLPADGRNLIQFGTDPLHLSYGYPRHSAASHYPYRGHYPTYPYYGYGHHHHGYYGHRPYYYPRSCYPYYGFYPWYGYGFGFGYTYSSAYLAEPYVAYVQPTYVVPSYSATEYVATDAYSAPATPYVAEPQQAAPSQPAAPAGQPPEGSEAYQPLEPSEEQRAVVMEGNAAFAEGRYDEARGLYSRAVLSDERDGYAKVLYAWANFAMGDFDTAATSLRRALLTTRDLLDYPMDLRTMYKDAGALPAQTERLARFVAENPQNRDAELLLAYLHYSAGDAQRAQLMFAGIANADVNDTIAAQLRDAADRAARGQTPPPPPRPDQGP